MHLNNHETIFCPIPQSMEKLSSMKLVPGAKKVGDCYPNCHQKCSSKREAEGDHTQKRREPCEDGGRDGSEGPQAKECWQSLEAEGGKDSPLEPLQGGQPQDSLISAPDSDVEFDVELWENKFLLFEATQLVMICCSSHWKLSQGQKKNSLGSRC